MSELINGDNPAQGVIDISDARHFLSKYLGIMQDNIEVVVRCKDCKHEETCCRSVSRNNGEGFCSDGERGSGG